MSLSLSRKQKKELKKLQKSATNVWEAQQVVASGAADVAREAGRQLESFGRKQVVPAVEQGYHDHLEPYVDRARPYVDKSVKAGRTFVNGALLPATAAFAGKAASAWDAANRAGVKYAQKYGALPPVPAKKKSSAGPVIALILGLAAAAGVLYAAWQTLRADDELWVADDPLAAPDA